MHSHSQVYPTPAVTDFETVYRNLDAVCDAGLIRFVDVPATLARLDGKRYAPRRKDDWTWASKV